MPKVLILTGPGGAGKSTIAKLIVERCGYEYMEGDREDTEFFPDGDQWLPENTENLQKAHIKVLLPSQEEMIKRDKERPIWTTGIDRIAAVSQEFVAIKDKIGAENFIDTTGQTPEGTFERHFSDMQKL